MQNDPTAAAERLEKCCGTCKWWKRCRYRSDYGECRCPLPQAYEIKYVVFSKKTEGTDCPCWQAKEVSDGK